MKRMLLFEVGAGLLFISIVLWKVAPSIHYVEKDKAAAADEKKDEGVEPPGAPTVELFEIEHEVVETVPWYSIAVAGLGIFAALLGAVGKIIEVWGREHGSS
jgi:hypothetical protein